MTYVIDIADLIVRRIVNILLVEVGDGGSSGLPNKDLRRTGGRWRRLLGEGCRAGAYCEYGGWDDCPHGVPIPVIS
jgi:hypothetical protein